MEMNRLQSTDPIIEESKQGGRSLRTLEALGRLDSQPTQASGRHAPVADNSSLMNPPTNLLNMGIDSN